MITLSIKYYLLIDSKVEIKGVTLTDVSIVPNIGDAIDYEYQSTRYYVTARDFYYSNAGKNCHVIVKAEMKQ